MSTYSKNEIIKKLEVAKSEMWKFYSQDFVNYRGVLLYRNYCEMVTE